MSDVAAGGQRAIAVSSQQRSGVSRHVFEEDWGRLGQGNDRGSTRQGARHANRQGLVTCARYLEIECWRWVGRVVIDGRPRFVKRSLDDGGKVKIAAIDPDFV
jgi:hypothetical protein